LRFASERSANLGGDGDVSAYGRSPGMECPNPLCLKMTALYNMSRFERVEMDLCF